MKVLLDKWAIFFLAFGCFGILFVMHPTTWLQTLIIISTSVLVIDDEFRSRYISLFKYSVFKSIAWPFLLWLAVAIAVALVHGKVSKFYFPENEFRIFLSVAVLCAGVHLKSKTAFYYGLVAGAIAAAVWAVYDVYIVHTWRAQGPTNNPIHFGNLTALGAVLSLSVWLLATDLRMKFRLLFLCGAVLYSFASYASLTRSSGVLIFCILPLALLPQKYLLDKKVTIGLCIALIVGVCFIGFSKPLQHYFRLDELAAASNNSQRLDYERLTSNRANMWHASILMFQEHPWSGVGPVGFTENFQLLIDEGRVQDTYTHNQPHNDILYAASMGGVFKLLAYIALILGPFLFFYKRYKANPLGIDRLFNVLGMQVVASFFLTGLTNSNFDLQIYSTTYAVLVCVLAKLSTLADSDAINVAEPSKPSTPAIPSC